MSLSSALNRTSSRAMSHLTRCLFLALGMGALRASAATLTFTNPADKFSYPNVADGAFGGVSTKASTFATLNTDDEDRLSGYMLMFNTSAFNLPQSQQYVVTSVKLTISVLTGDAFVYDATHDSYRSSLLPSDPLYAGDEDDGKPVEVFGIGLRGNYTRLNSTIGANPADGSYGEASPILDGNGVRYAYPIGKSSAGTLINVSDNVSQHQEATPFAVGTTTLTPGDVVPQGTKFTFSLELSDADIQAYVKNGLTAGVLGLYVSSLHGAEQTGPDVYPRFYTREGAAPFPVALGLSPKLELQYIVVPEPRLSGLLIAGVALVAAGRGIRHRNRLS
jgi:hypothetical protein